jgi:pyruvate/2-oxoglutarate dehydrogenase complex dihydrolipoamide acyltransferase (E2) component
MDMEIKNVAIKEIVPFNLQRKVAAHKTVESWHNIPHAGITIDLDVTEILQFIKRTSNMFESLGVRVTFNAIILKVITEGLKQAPQLNAYVEYSKSSGNGTMYHCEDINVAVPSLLPDGRMITPVIPQLQNKNLKEICIEMEKMETRVKNTDIELLLFEAVWNDTIERLKKVQIYTVLRRFLGNFIGRNRIRMPSKAELTKYHKIPEDQRVTPKELLSATVLFSNIGATFRGFPCNIAMIEVIPPQSAVFGIASIRRTPWVIKNDQGEEEIVIRDVAPLTIMADHRGNDFGPAIGMLKKIMELCAQPDKIIQ